MAPEAAEVTEAAVTLDMYRQRFARPPQWGCSEVAHERLGFCDGCPTVPSWVELTAWRLLAMTERVES